MAHARERLASLTRQCRHAAARQETLERGMYLIGCRYNFCFPHQELTKKRHFGCPTTPAMAAGLTDHIWDIRELLRYKVVPPLWMRATSGLPTRPRGRPRKQKQGEQPSPKRPRGRPPKYVLTEVLAAARAAGAFTS
jgi:hypothetical protein